MPLVKHCHKCGDYNFPETMEVHANNCQGTKTGPFVRLGSEEGFSPLSVQEGGNHYKHLKIEPIEYIFANNLGFAEGSIIKYVTRYKNKNGVEDLKKARHFIDLLIEEIQKADSKSGNAS